MTNLQILIISKPNCYACKVALDLLQSIIKSKNLNIEINIKCTTDLTDAEKEKYDEVKTYPAIHFMKNGEILFSRYGTYNRALLLNFIDTAFDLS